MSHHYTDLQRRLATGRNTWNTRSVLSQVLLPEGIAINLGFKHYAGGDYLKEALIGRSGEHDEKIHPGPRSYDGRYTELRLDWKGCSWRVQTAAQADELVILITPLRVQEPRAPSVVAEIGLLWNRAGSLTHGTGCVIAQTATRSISLYATAPPVTEPYVWAQGPYLAVACDKPVGFSTHATRDLPDIQARIEAARAARLQESASWGALAEVRDAMHTCLAWDTVYDPLFDRVISPVSRIWNINWGGYVMFCWDSYFAAAMAAVDNKELAYANAIAVTREGIASGFVPNLLKEWREHGHVHENYCGDTGQGCNSRSSDAFYHWGGLLGLIAILER